jgi:hypothetical protein
MRNDAGAFFDGDDLVDGEIFQLIDLAAGPGDFERINFGVFAQAEEDAWVAGGHVAHAALGLFDVSPIACADFEGSAEAVAIGFCPDEENLEKVISVAAVVAKKHRIVTAIVDGQIDIAIVVKIRGGDATPGDGAAEIGAERAIGNFFELAFA